MNYRIGTVEVRPASREVLRAGAAVHPEPRLFDLLMLLIERDGSVVSKDEMISRVWGGRAISDDAITSALRDLRALLGDDGRRQEIIRTVYGFGVRLAVPAEPLTPDTAGSTTTRPTIAVIPLTPLAPEDAPLARAVTRDLTIALARTRWLFVTSPGSAAALEGDARPTREVAERFGVRYLLSGTLARNGTRLRASFLLSDIREGRELWGQTLTRPVDDVFEVFDEVARTVAAGVEAEVAHRERARALLAPMSGLDAWSAYHKAMALLFRFSRDQFDPARALLEQAAELDPTSARIRAAQSFLHWQQAFLQLGEARKRELDVAAALARESVALDPHDPQGYWALGRAHIPDGDVGGAEAQLNRAIELNPSFASAQYSLAWSLSQDPSRRDDSKRHLDKALRLSPVDPMIYGFHILEADLAQARGEHDLAARKALEAASHPWAHHHVLAIASWILEASGQPDHARAMAAEVRRRKPGYDFNDYAAAVPLKGEKHRMVKEIFQRLDY